MRRPCCLSRDLRLLLLNEIVGQLITVQTAKVLRRYAPV
ncbi:hypothetical protein JOE48_001293 [Methylobacterium sp. PvR107]|nr:hypothetical protein [Methylobacterium sp. PvR107]